MTLRTILRTAVVIIIECLVVQAVAYETPTHSDISHKAIDRSILVQDPMYLRDLGITVKLDEPAFPSEVPVTESNPQPDITFYMPGAPVRRIIKAGTVLEDGSTNSLHHFYDPLNGGRGLTLEAFGHPIAVGKPSPDWILDPQDNDDDQKGFPQNFSYSDTLDYLYLALTSNQKAVRDLNFGLMFRGVGHLIHHIQDMAQPQHVRNDQHCDSKDSFLCRPLNNPSHFEKYTDLFRKAIIANAGSYNIPDFPVAKHYWDNVSGSGLADFTLSNFISQNTNFELDSLGHLGGSSRYPVPVPLPEEITSSYDLFTLLQQEGVDPDEINKIVQNLECNQPLICEMDFIASNVIDTGLPGTGSIHINYRASTISLLDDELRKRDLRNGITTTYNRLNFHSAYPYLISRAIAYSAGLINHFFRGRISIESAEPDENNNIVITVANKSSGGSSFRDGRFELYYDSTGGGRKPVSVVQSGAGSLPLNVGETLQLIMIEPPDVNKDLEKPYLLVFNAVQGQLGAEAGIAATRFDISIVGRVDRLSRGAGNCPDRVYGVSILFQQQPENNGQVVLVGQQSAAVFDFTTVPAGTMVIRGKAMWRHQIDEFTDEYKYEVTYRYPGSSADPCNSQLLGPWIQDEVVSVFPLLN